MVLLDGPVSVLLGRLLARVDVVTSSSLNELISCRLRALNQLMLMSWTILTELRMSVCVREFEFAFLTHGFSFFVLYFYVLLG